MSSPLRILHLEDNGFDAQLAQEMLETEGIACRVTRVETAPAFVAALQQGGFDLILGDYALPSFDGMSALRMTLQHRPDVPFIFVSGTMGEEVAIEALKIGATDYVLKTRLSRLVFAVRRALREARERADLRRTERELHEREAMSRRLFDANIVGIFIWDLDGRILEANDEFLRIVGYDRENLISGHLSWKDLTPREWLDRDEQVLVPALKITGALQPFEKEYFRKDGSRVPVLIGVASFEESRNEGVAFVLDLTERKRAEETLREQANLLSLTYDAIFVRDMNFVISYWNRAAEELYGWTAEEAKGKVSPELLKTVFPIPLEEIKAQLLSDERWEGELVRTTKGGTQLLVSSRWSLQRDQNGTPMAILETNNDVTERKRAEKEREQLRQVEADLAHMNRVSMMGELAASLSHELKQPMTAAIMNARTCSRWLTSEQPDLEQAREAATRAIKDVTRAVDVIDRLRCLYRKGAPAERELVDVNEIVDEMIVLLRSEANRFSLPVRTMLAAELPKIRADRVQVQQVFMNLMLNAIEAMRESAGELTIKTELGRDRNLLISVSDTGVGLPADKGSEIFNPFFTTKTQGSGMGLTISRSIVEAHGGRLWATANPGRGATFYFTLPVEAATLSPSAA